MVSGDLAGAPVAPAAEVASWGRRFGAWIIDWILLSIVPSFIMFGRMMGELADAGLLNPNAPANPIQIQSEVNEIVSGMMGEFIWISLLFNIVSFLYFVLMHGVSGRTLGKMATGIKVIKEDGTPCDLGAAAKRGVVHPLASGVPTVGVIVLVLNGLWPLWDQKHQSLGDKLGATYVVRRSPQPQPVPPAA